MRPFWRSPHTAWRTCGAMRVERLDRPPRLGWGKAAGRHRIPSLARVNDVSCGLLEARGRFLIVLVCYAYRLNTAEKR